MTTRGRAPSAASSRSSTVSMPAPTVPGSTMSRASVTVSTAHASACLAHLLIGIAPRAPVRGGV